MFTSIGYHTFAISRSLTQEEAEILFKAFKRHVNGIKDICIIGPHKYEKDLFGRHYDIIYPKVFSKSAEIRRKRERQKSILMEYMGKQGLGNFSEVQGGMEDDEKKQVSETVMDIARSDEAVIMEEMLSDEKCSRTIEAYFYKVIKEGDYYAFDTARQIIEARVSKWEKKKLINDYIKDCRKRGIPFI